METFFVTIIGSFVSSSGVWIILSPIWAIVGTMTSAEQKRKNNREAQTRYRQRKKMRQARLEDNVRQATGRVEHLKRILKQRVNKEVPYQSKEVSSPTTYKDRICMTESRTELFSGVADMGQESIAPHGHGPYDPSMTSPPHVTQSDLDFLINWEHGYNDLIHMERDATNVSGTEVPLDDQRLHLESHGDTATPHDSPTLDGASSQEIQPLATMMPDDIRPDLGVESNPQDSEIYAPDQNVEPSFPCLERPNMSVRSTEYPPYLGAKCPLDRTGTNFTMWSATQASVPALGSGHMVVQHFLYALQNVMLLANNPMDFTMSNNCSFCSSARLERRMDICPS